MTHSFRPISRFYHLACLLILLIMSSNAGAGNILNAIKKQNYIRCGVNTALAGFAIADSKGKWVGLDVDFCKAVAAAVFGDATKVEFVPLSAQQRFTAIQSGEIDLLSRNTTWTLTRDAALGALFTGVTFYDGQGFMVPKSLGVKSAKELAGAEICVTTGTTSELNLADYFRQHGMKFKPVVFESLPESKIAFFSGRCQAYSTDRSGLASIRTEAKNPADYVILPEVISKEPLGPMIRRGDDEWFAIVRWVQYALLIAEEKGVTSKNVDQMKKSKDPIVQRLLGVSGDMGNKLELNNQWAANAIKAVGNYGEIYERNITPLGVKRKGSQNALLTDGGLMYPMPIR